MTNKDDKDKIKKFFNLEDRAFKFAQKTLKLVKKLPKNQINNEHTKQLIRSSGSVGANYIEANEAVSKKDCVKRIKICRKEAKESAYWLRLLDRYGDTDDCDKFALIDEATQPVKIFNALIKNTKL